MMHHFCINHETLANITQKYENSNSYKDTSEQYRKLLPKDRFVAHETDNFRKVDELRKVTQIRTWLMEEEKVISERSFSAKRFPEVIAIYTSYIRIDVPSTTMISILTEKSTILFDCKCVAIEKKLLICL